MRSKALLLAISATLLAGPVVSAFADDGEIFRRQTSSEPGLTLNPEPEGEHAFIQLMNFRVPAQAADGTLLDTLEYITYDGEVALTTTDAKPLINVFVYGPVISFDDFSQSGFPGHGRRDAFAAVSLDDGATWKRTNLSNSADQSSFDIAEPGIPDPGVPQPEFEVTTETEYVVTSALAQAVGNSGNARLTVDGVNAPQRGQVDIRNAITQVVLGSTKAKNDGSFTFRENNVAAVPCTVQAGDEANGIWGPVLEVVGADPETCEGSAEPTLITAYPGDVTNIFHSVAGNRVLVAWQSKFCSSGFPGYTGGNTDADTIAGYLGINNDADLYLTDLFGVAGDQLSVDYREQEEFEGEYADVGEVPYNCLWSARGVLRENPDALGTTEVVWLQAERLTSGRRDVNRIETACTAGGGCAVTWQEDPEGLRPGEGEGAGTGWAGATTNSQTDIWYSFIAWEDFDIVDNNGTFEPLGDLSLQNELGTGRPQPAVPMAVPMRLTNNARCQTDATTGYCASDAAAAYGLKDQCVGTVDIPLGPQGELQPVCIVDSDDSGTVSAADMPNVANTAASRPRLNVQPRDTDGDGVTDDAWVVIIHEEDKGLGRFPFLNDEPYVNETTFGTRCEDETLENCKREIGKNQWYISFAMGGPATSASEPEIGLVDNLVAQQNMYNAPEVNWVTGTFYPPMSTDDMWDFSAAGITYSIFNTEIARRASLMSQSLGKATTNATTGLMAMPLFKEGTINQGGPADIMARRVVLPDDFPGEATANPYDFENLECAWYDGEGTVTPGTTLYADGSNPYYPKGLCTAPTINLSSRTPDLCEQSGISGTECLSANMTCTDDTAFGQLCITDIDPEDNQLLPKLLSWYECPGWNGTDVSVGGNTGAATVPGACGTEPFSVLLGANLDDRSWYSPMDISKAHRGFLDGDHVFMIYAWSPNYKLNAVGQDRYELYTRRSFDGGISWTTTPGSFLASDGVTYTGTGTTTCETWRDGADSQTDSHICTLYGAGDPEQSRDVSQHKSMAITTLDPRYTPTIASMPTEGDLEWAIYEPLDPTDLRRPDRNFVVFESGDNTTVAVGEAEPLNLDYGRAIMFGDHFQVWAEEDDIANCYPNNNHTDVTTNPLDPAPWAVGTGFCNEFDPMEGFPDALSEEASITSSAAGDFLYGTWGQFNVDEAGEFVDGDVMFRRIWYLDEYIPSNAWTKGNQ